MGADVFTNHATGKDADDAFSKAIKADRYENGHRGYTGTISQKTEFTMIKVPGVVGLPTLAVAEEHANRLIDAEDKRIDDKWGPAGCIEVLSTTPGFRGFLFFGWASC